MRARFAALVLPGATTAGEQSKGSADFSGPSACPRGAAASPGVTGGLQWGFEEFQLRNEKTSQFQLRFLHFSQQLQFPWCSQATFLHRVLITMFSVVFFSMR